MGRPRTKTDLIEAASANYDKLMEMIDEMTSEGEDIVFDFSQDEKKKEKHWRRDKNIRDILIHLHEWHMLTIDCIAANEAGEKKSFLPEEYTWKTYGDMNQMFWEKHQNTSLEEARNLLEHSHQKMMELIERYSNEEMFSKGVFAWTGGSSMGSYFVSNTSSHYDWAMKKLKAAKKMQAKSRI